MINMKKVSLVFSFVLSFQLVFCQDFTNQQTIKKEQIIPVWNHILDLKNQMDTTHQELIRHFLNCRVERSFLAESYSSEASASHIKRRFKSNKYGSTRHRLIYKDYESFKMKIVARNGNVSFVKFKTKKDLKTIFSELNDVQIIKYRFVFIDDVVYVSYRILFKEYKININKQIQLPVTDLKPLFN